MVEISNLRKHPIMNGVGVRLEADIKFLDMDVKYPATSMYFDIRKDYAPMFSTDTYDAFVLVGMYLAMYHHTDLRIRGNMSKKLYKNCTWYIQKILCDFSDVLRPAKIFVEGFAPTQAKGTLIGTGISCGVDSLSTIYDRFVRESDPDYRVNSLFIFNCGSHGDFGAPHTQIVFKSRVERAIQVADELKLPAVIVDSNLHQFRHDNDKDTVLFLSFYSCVLSMQAVIKRYYISSGCSYSSIKDLGRDNSMHHDLATSCDSFLIPLIQTERIELIIDGCQYRRVDKVRNMINWEIAQKYLNVCLIQKGEDSTNCGKCSKCLRTLLTIEILGKLDDFSKVFDIEAYKKESLAYKARSLENVDSEIFYKENVELAKELNFPMPERKPCYILNGNVVVINDK